MIASRTPPIALTLGLLLACEPSTPNPPDRVQPDAEVDVDASVVDAIAAIDADVEDASRDAGVEDSGPPPPPLVWGRCDTTEWPAGYPLPSRLVECSTVAAPLDHSVPGGAQIVLRLARQVAQVTPSRGAVFQLAGGPGGNAVAQSGIIPRAMPRLNETFDLIYVDQRGTGGSGYLGCTGDPATEAEWRACASEHRGVPLQHYLTLDAAHDLDLVRQRLGYDQIYLRGGSYGTRLGLEYLREHGEHVAAAVLDGLVPPDSHFYESFIENFDRGVSLLVADCAREAACSSISPNLQTTLEDRRTTLRMAPRPIRVGGQRYEEDEATYLTALAIALGDSYYRFGVPRAIAHAASGDNTEWNALLSDLFGVAVTDDHGLLEGGARASLHSLAPLEREVRARSYVAPGLYMAVLCAEDLPNTPDLGALALLADQQVWGDDHVLETARACPAWMLEDIGPARRSPVVSSVKTLLMSGALDLNTFPEEGTHAAETLDHSTHLIIPFATHSTMLVPCAAEIMTDFFLAEGDMSSVDTSCIGRLTHSAW